MSDADPTAADEPTLTDQAPVDPTAKMAAVGAEPPGEEPPGGDGERPWYQNPWVIAAVVVGLLTLVGLIWWAASSDDESATITTTTTELPTTEELIAACLAQDGPEADEACAVLAETLTDEEKADLTRRCSEGDAEACRLLELIGEPVPTPTTTSSSTTAPPGRGGDTIIVIPPPEPGEPTPPDPTIPELPDPTLEEIAEACLAQDGAVSDLACQYLADNLTDSQKDAVRQECIDGNQDACRLLELIGEQVPETTTTTDGG